ncbi:prohibitin family protein [bacterium]|jgi:regulator of protease activity HflC (stomatin/prohibitin superfamily)|nr:prohibitin family protein [bacterium]MBT6754363.1 prohibitin family protein [bacterium]
MAEPINIDATKIRKKFTSFWKFFLLLFLVVVFVPKLLVTIDAGETGVYSLFGKVKDKELSSGLHIVNPLGVVTRMNIRTDEYTMSVIRGEGRKQGIDSIAALTKEGLSIDLDITVLYHLDEEEAARVYRTVGLEYEEKVIRPEIRSSIREIIAQYEAKDVYSEKREEANKKLKDTLDIKLKKRGIVLEDVLLRNVQLPVNLARTIQEKLQAEQESQKYEFIIEKETKEKQRKIIEAEGQREAQTIINESLSSNYLYYLYIKDLKDRQGTIYVPTNPSTGMPTFKELGR